MDLIISVYSQFSRAYFAHKETFTDHITGEGLRNLGKEEKEAVHVTRN